MINSNGISSAMNDALKFLISSNNFIWILHAGDLCINNFMKKINSESFYDLHFFPIYIKNIKFQKRFLAFTSKVWLETIKKKPCVMHQGLIAHSNVFRKFGLFDENLKSIMIMNGFKLTTYKKISI